MFLFIYPIGSAESANICAIILLDVNDRLFSSSKEKELRDDEHMHPFTKGRTLRHFNVTTCISVQINEPKKGVGHQRQLCTQGTAPTRKLFVFISKKFRTSMQNSKSTSHRNYFIALIYQFTLYLVL